MTDLTRVIACKTRDQAAEEVGLLLGAGNNVVVIDGTDAIELIGTGDTRITWESGSSFDWVLVIASSKAITPQ